MLIGKVNSLKKRQSRSAIVLAASLLALSTLFAACKKQPTKTGSSASSSSEDMSSVSSVRSETSADSSATSSTHSDASSSSSAVSSKPSVEAGYTLYSNARFGYSLPVPSTLKAVSSTSSSGQTFVNADHTVICSVSGSNNAQNLSPSDYFNQYFYSKQAGIVSKQENGNTTLVSWNVDGKYGYIKSVVGTGSINTVRFQFPEGDKAQYAASALYILDHFETPSVGTSH